MSEFPDQPNRFAEQWTFVSDIFLFRPKDDFAKILFLKALTTSQGKFGSQKDPNILPVHFTMPKGWVHDLVGGAEAQLHSAFVRSKVVATVLNMAAIPVINGNDQPDDSINVTNFLLNVELQRYTP